MKNMSKYLLVLAMTAVLAVGGFLFTAEAEKENDENYVMDPGGGGHVVDPTGTDVAFGEIGTLSDPGGGGH